MSGACSVTIVIAIVVAALCHGAHSSPVVEAKQELAGGLSVLHHFLLLEEYNLTNSTLRFENSPLMTMSVLLRGYVSLISFVRQHTNNSQFANDVNLELMEVVMTELIRDLCYTLSSSSDDAFNCTSDAMHFSSQDTQLFNNTIDNVLWTTAVSLRRFISETEYNVIVDGSRDYQWPFDNIEDTDLRTLLCTVLLRGPNCDE